MSILAGIGLAGNILNAFGAAAERRKREQEMMMAINEMSRNSDSQFQNVRKNNITNLRAMSGSLQDELQGQAGALGSGLAEAGIYNSSAAAGSVTNLAARNAALLAQFQRQSMQQQLDVQSQGQRDITQTKLSMASGNLASARSNSDSALGRLGGSIQDLVVSRSPKNKGVAGNGKQNGTLMKQGNRVGFSNPLDIWNVGNTLGGFIK